MPNVPYHYEVRKWQIGHGKWFHNTNKFLMKPFLIAKFDCISKINVLKTKCKLKCQNEFCETILKSGNTNVYCFYY